MELTLETSVQYVPRVGPMMAKRLEKLSIKTVKDLLCHVPFRYDDFSLVSPIAHVQPGEIVTVKATVQSIRLKFTKTGKKLIEATVTDDTGSLAIIWFNQPFLVNIIKPDTKLSLSGKVDWFGHNVVLSSPSYEIIYPNQPQELQPQACLPARQGSALSSQLHTGRLVPVYPETEGVSSKWLRGRIDYCLHQTLSRISDPLPDFIRYAFHLMPRTKAISCIHFPDTVLSAEKARHRLSFDELFTYQLRAFEQRQLWEQTMKSYLIEIDAADVESFLRTLPFVLTGDQLHALNDILRDFTRNFPMNRLLEGDVGSGKTVVAAIAMYSVCRNGFSSVLMAPTQILAEQHFQTISTLLNPIHIDIRLITAHTHRSSADSLSVQPSERSTPTIYIGTHALLFEKFHKKNIGLIIIDEQQRFGVNQRTKLMERYGTGKTPHILTMTATPIPRTAARVLFGNIDLSVLNDMPKGRQKVKTWVVSDEKRDKAYAWIQTQLTETHSQAFIICPFINDSETLLTIKAVKTEFERLKHIFPSFRLGLLHGRMKPKVKTGVLEQFRTHAIDILAATPVVEVGIDIPNATIMVIEGAERFGLSQLHQLRGRVGRGMTQSYCLLFTEDTQELTIKRLKVLETSFSGPDIAQKDLELRGPGDPFGTRQHGLPPLKIASYADKETIKETMEAVRMLAEKDPSLSHFPLLREELNKSTIKDASID